MASAGLNQYELEREKRIAENKRKMEELGVADAAAAFAASKPAPKRQKKAKAAVSEDSGERRVSGRERKAVNYCEMDSRTAREPKAPVDYSERIKAMTLDQETAEQLRKEMASKKSSSGGKSGGKTRGPVDSGKGVRIQGGRVYDSAHGVTCHWCRQKTLEDHVTCTNADCGGGRRMPLSFCAKCLRNRHGEDCDAAEASNGWWCPCCRGSCGAGCVGCCNCGLCRKKMGLEPTHQVVRLARDAGFSNVHDYLVHLVTGETQEVIAARKLNFPWGRWLKGDGAAGEEEEAGGSEVSAQTDACKAGCSHHHSKRAGSAVSDDVGQDADTDQGPTSAAGAGRGKGRAGKKAGKQAAAASKGGKKATAAAAAAAAAEVEVAAQQQEEQEPAEPEDDDVPMLSSQDMTLPRKQRIMQALGLAPSTIITKA